jgi:hypothetical protein
MNRMVVKDAPSATKRDLKKERLTEDRNHVWISKHTL